MALGAVLGQLAAMPSLPQKDRADYHDEAVQALQQAYACDPDDVDIVYNLALVQVKIAYNMCSGQHSVVALDAMFLPDRRSVCVGLITVPDSSV